MNDLKVEYKGLSFPGALTIVFIVLKLVGIIDWGWIWIVCPLWISLLGFFILLIVYACIDRVVWRRK